MKEQAFGFDEIGFKIERFLQKNKIIIAILLVLIIAFFAFKSINNYLENSKNEQANSLYLELLKNDDASKLAELEKLNPNLVLALVLQNRSKQKELTNSDALLNEIYKAKELKSDKFLGELKILKEAYELLKKDEIKQAKILLKSIPNTSAFYTSAKLLMHYQGNK